MFRVVTRNSVYTVAPVGTAFYVKRIADLWGRKVTNDHAHYTRHLQLAVGSAMATDHITTSVVQAVTPGV